MATIEPRLTTSSTEVQYFKKEYGIVKDKTGTEVKPGDRRRFTWNPPSAKPFGFSQRAAYTIEEIYREPLAEGTRVYLKFKGYNVLHPLDILLISPLEKLA